MTHGMRHELISLSSRQPAQMDSHGLRKARAMKRQDVMWVRLLVLAAVWTGAAINNHELAQVLAGLAGKWLAR